MVLPSSIRTSPAVCKVQVVESSRKKKISPRNESRKGRICLCKQDRRLGNRKRRGSQARKKVSSANQARAREVTDATRTGRESGFNCRIHLDLRGDHFACILCITYTTHASGDHRTGQNQFSASNPRRPSALWWHRSFVFRTPEDGEKEDRAMSATLWIRS